MAYKPKLDREDDHLKIDSESSDESENDDSDRIDSFLKEVQNDPICMRIIDDVTNNVDRRRAECTDESHNLTEGVRRIHVNPFLIGSLTTKNLILEFYHHIKVAISTGFR